MTLRRRILVWHNRTLSLIRRSLMFMSKELPGPGFWGAMVKCGWGSITHVKPNRFAHPYIHLIFFFYPQEVVHSSIPHRTNFIIHTPCVCVIHVVVYRYLLLHSYYQINITMWLKQVSMRLMRLRTSYVHKSWALKANVNWSFLQSLLVCSGYSNTNIEFTNAAQGLHFWVVTEVGHRHYCPTCILPTQVQV